MRAKTTSSFTSPHRPTRASNLRAVGRIASRCSLVVESFRAHCLGLEIQVVSGVPAGRVSRWARRVLLLCCAVAARRAATPSRASRSGGDARPNSRSPARLLARRSGGRSRWSASASPLVVAEHQLAAKVSRCRRTQRPMRVTRYRAPRPGQDAGSAGARAVSRLLRRTGTDRVPPPRVLTSPTRPGTMRRLERTDLVELAAMELAWVVLRATSVGASTPRLSGPRGT